MKTSLKMIFAGAGIVSASSMAIAVGQLALSEAAYVAGNTASGDAALIDAGVSGGFALLMAVAAALIWLDGKTGE